MSDHSRQHWPRQDTDRADPASTTDPRQQSANFVLCVHQLSLLPFPEEGSGLWRTLGLVCVHGLDAAKTSLRLPVHVYVLPKVPTLCARSVKSSTEFIPLQGLEFTQNHLIQEKFQDVLNFIPRATGWRKEVIRGVNQ